jgi:hypothetical protein
MAKDLLARLVPEAVEDHYELLHLLESRFGSAGASKPNCLVYPSSPNYVIKIFWKEGRVSRIEPGLAGLSDAQCEELQREIKATLVDSPGNVVFTDVLLSYPRRVSGQFQAGDLRILPAPSQAPRRPPGEHADHPFLIEVSLRRSADAMITQMRAWRRRVETAWLLNALLRTSVKLSTRIRSKHTWVTCTADTPWSLHWCQEGYNYDGFPSYREGFSDAGVPQITSVPDDEYYGQAFLQFGDEMLLPASLTEMLNLVHTLSREDRRRLFRAARWISAAREVWDYNASACFVALVAAVESLVSKEKAPKCTKCGQVAGVTERFKEFVERHVQGDDINKKRLYGIRSELVHGISLLNLDEAPWAAFVHKPHDLEQQEAFDGLYWLSKRVFVSWLKTTASQIAPWAALLRFARSKTASITSAIARWASGSTKE